MKDTKILNRFPRPSNIDGRAMKRPRTYGFSPYVLMQLEDLKQLDRYKDYAETDIVQEAIGHLWVQRIMKDKPEKKTGGNP